MCDHSLFRGLGAAARRAEASGFQDMEFRGKFVSISNRVRPVPVGIISEKGIVAVL